MAARDDTYNLESHAPPESSDDLVADPLAGCGFRSKGAQQAGPHAGQCASSDSPRRDVVESADCGAGGKSVDAFFLAVSRAPYLPRAPNAIRARMLETSDGRMCTALSTGESPRIAWNQKGRKYGIICVAPPWKNMTRLPTATARRRRDDTDIKALLPMCRIQNENKAARAAEPQSRLMMIGDDQRNRPPPQVRLSRNIVVSVVMRAELA